MNIMAASLDNGESAAQMSYSKYPPRHPEIDGRIWSSDLPLACPNLTASMPFSRADYNTYLLNYIDSLDDLNAQIWCSFFPPRLPEIDGRRWSSDLPPGYPKLAAYMTCSEADYIDSILVCQI